MGAEGATGVLSLTGDVIAGGAALAGLILVYLGSVSAGYASYDKQDRGPVRGSYQHRAWFAVVGITLAIAASGMALLGKWLSHICLAGSGVVFLALALVWVVATAVLVATEVK
jgi:hypothetical protein